MSDDPTTPEAPFADALFAEHLFTTADAATPDPEFAAALRRRIEEAAGITSPTPQEVTMTTTAHATAHPGARYRPPGAAALTPYLAVDGARAAIAWYQDVFGAVVTYEPIVMEDDRIGHVELTIDGTTFQMADEFPELDVLGPVARGGSSVSLSIYVPDVDATYALALERGAEGEREPADQFYGSRAGHIRDPFGHRWGLQTYLGDDAVGPPPAGPTQARDLWNEVGYYVINVPELEPARTFWGGLLGWEFAESREAHDTPGEYAHVESSTVPFGLHGGGDTTPTWQPYIRVQDLDAAVAKVRELGGTVESVDHGYDSGGGAVCFDDQGTRFELWQPAEGY